MKLIQLAAMMAALSAPACPYIPQPCSGTECGEPTVTETPVPAEAPTVAR